MMADTTENPSVTKESQNNNTPKKSSSRPISSQGLKSPKVQSHSKQERPKKFAVKKRPPPKELNRPNDIYIGEKSNLQFNLSKCKKFLDGEYSEIFLYGLGPAIPKALNIALELKSFYHGTVDVSVTTSTVKLIDDLIPLEDTTAPAQKFRIASSVNIRVFRVVQIP